MTTEEIIEKYKKYLTKAQIKGLIEATERTRQLHAGQRAEAQSQLNQQYRSARRGLQNMGLAAREGKIISGREGALRSAVDRSYGQYNRQLNRVEQAQVEQQAVRMANKTIKARQQQQEEELQKQLEQLQQAEEERRQQLKDELRGGRNGVLSDTGGGVDYRLAEIQAQKNAIQKILDQQRKQQNAQYRGMTDTGGGEDYRIAENQARRDAWEKAEARRQQWKDELRGGRNGMLTDTYGGVDYRNAETQAQLDAYNRWQENYKLYRDTRGDLVNQWNRFETDTATGDDRYVNRIFADDPEGMQAFRALPASQRLEFISMAEEAYNAIDENWLAWQADIDAANNYNGAQEQDVLGHENTKTLSGSFREDTGRYDSYELNRSRYRRSVHPMSRYSATVQRANKARRAQATEMSKLFRIQASVHLNDNERNMLFMSDSDFSAVYDAAKERYEKALKDKGNDQVSYFAVRSSRAKSEAEKYGIDYDPDARTAQIDNELAAATAAFVSAETVRQIRNQTSVDALYYKTYENANADKYLDDGLKGSHHSFGTINTGRWGEGDYYVYDGNNPYKNESYDAWQYDQDHGTEGSKYAAIVNQFGRMIDNPAQTYSWRGTGKGILEDFGRIGDAVGSFDFSKLKKTTDSERLRHLITDVDHMHGEQIAGNVGNTARKQIVEARIACSYYMTSHEIDTFNSILATEGDAAADEYFESLVPELTDRLMYAINQDNVEMAAVDAASDFPWLASLATTPVNLWQGLTQPVKNMVIGQQDVSAAKLEAMRSDRAGQYRNAVASRMNSAGAFFYQTGMSMVDSAVVAVISAGIGNVLQGAGMAANIASKVGSAIGGSLLGGSAFNSAYSEALQRGLTPDKARMTALGTGINEMLFETLSIGTLLEKTGKQFIQTGLTGAKGAFVDWVVNACIQAGVEGSEEVFTDIANRLWDNQVNGIYSEELEAVRAYFEDGKSRGLSDKDAYNQAVIKAQKDFAIQLGMSFAGGAISGGVMAGGGEMYNNIKQGYGVFGQRNPYYQAVRDAKSFDSTMRETLDTYEFKNKDAQEIQQKNRKTNQDYAQLYDTMRGELYDKYKGNIEQAVKDGVITKEDAALLQKYQENGVQVVDKDGNIVKNEDGVTKEELQTVNETLAKLDIEPMQQIVQMEQDLEFNKAVGVKNAETLREYDTKMTEAEKQYNEEKARIEADETLTDAQKEQKIAEAAQARADAKSAAASEFDKTWNKSGKGKLKVGVDKNGIGYVETKKGSGKVTFDFSTEGHNTLDTMTAREQAALRIAQVVASRGVNVKVESEFGVDEDGVDHRNENGYYNRNTQTIHVNMKGDNAVLYTVSHELTHHLANVNKQAYNDLRNAIRDELKRSDLTASELEQNGFEYDKERVVPFIQKTGNLWDGLVQYEAASKEEGGRGYGENAEEEVVARCCESFLANDVFIDSFAKKHFKSAKAISSFLTQFSADMNQLFTDADIRAAKTNKWINESPEQQILSQVANVQEIAQKWSRAVNALQPKRVKAEGTRAATKDNELRDASKVTSEEVQELLERVRNGEIVKGYIPVNKKTPAILLEIAQRYEKAYPLLKGLTDRSMAMAVDKAEQAMREGIKGEKNRGHGLEPDDIIHIIDSMEKPKAVYYQEKNDYLNVVVGFKNSESHEVYAIVSFWDKANDAPRNIRASDMNGYDGGEYNIEVTLFSPDLDTVKRYIRKEENVKLYDRKNGFSRLIHENIGNMGDGHESTTNSISSKTDSVKRSDAEYLDLAKKYTDGTATDTDKAELRKQVDAVAKENGYTFKAFHGTSSDFTKFDRGSQGKNYRGYLEFGAGFYFTPSEKEAQEWAKTSENKNGGNAHVMGVYLNPKRIIAADAPVPGGAKYLQGLGIDKGTAEFISARTYRFINALIDERGFTNVEAQETLMALGYDAIDATFANGTGQYVVYDPSQIKSADLVTYDDKQNIIPLSERFDENMDDIRYSMMDKVFRMTDKNGMSRTFEQGDTKATVYGSSVELEGGTLLNRVRMMQNLAEMYGSVTVTATSEKEAQAFERAGAKRETDTFGDTEYGTWAFEHKEDQYREDTRYDAKQKRNFANAVLKEVGTYRNFTKEDLRIIRARLEKAFAILHNAWHGQGDQLVAMEYADKLFDAILNRYTEMSEADAEMRDAILAEIPSRRDAKGHIIHDIEVTAAQMAEIKHVYGSVAAYNQALTKALGTRVYVKEAQNAQTLEDVFANNPYLDATTNEGDMPTVLLERAQETVGKRTNPYKADSEERAALKEAMFEKALTIVGIEKSTAQKVREAVKQARAEERAKAKDKTANAVAKVRAEERAKARKREAKLKDVTQKKIANLKVEQLRRDVKTIALKWNQRLVKMLANPTEASHIPVQLAREVAEFTDALTRFLDSGTERGQINLAKIAKAYQQAFDDQATIAQAKSENPKYDPRGTVLDREMYDEQLVQMMNELNEVLQGKTLKDLDAFEMRMLLNTVRGVAHTVYEANRMIGTTERKAIWQVGDKMVSELENAPKVSNKLRGYLETSLDLRRLAKIFSGSNENAEFVKLVEQLNKGAIEKERIAQTLQSIFKPVTDQYGNEIRKWYGKNAEWIDTGITKNGKKVEITKGMRVSLALHVLNEGNMRHIENGGLTIPNREMYRKGNLQDAYANGDLVRLNAEQIDEIISHMTDAEKAYVEAAKELFHKRTGYFINKTSLALLGYRKAIVENYFPIHTDKNFTKTDFASLKMDGSIEGQGFLKERVNASNPVYLEDITSVVNRQIRGVALYAGLAIPMRNFNAVMNASIYEDDNGVWSPRTTVKQTLTQKMGDYGRKVVEGFLSDVSEMSHVDVTPMERFAGRLANNYVKAVLLGNAKVALKQIASYPTAAAVIPWKYLGKALLAGGRNHRLISRADVDLINQYTPLYQMRREGMANEIASIAQKRGLEDKLPWLLKWITKFDVMTVGRLWSAAEYMVADQQKNLPVGSDEYYKAVAQVFNDTIQQTQPNFTPLQRNAALRSKNPIVRSLVLFGTQRMQNGGILMEAAYELKQSKGKSKAEIQAAKRKLGRAVASQVVQNILLIVASLGVDALRGRMKGWQDKDKEITVESLAKGMGDMFLSNFIGSFLGGSEVYNLISTIYKKVDGDTTYDTEFTVPALDAAETIINTVGKLPDLIKYLTGDHTLDEKLNKMKTFGFDLAKAAGYATGIPMENALKDLFKGIIPAIKDHADYFKTGEFPQWWLHQSGKLDSAKTAANYKEWTNAGKKGSTYFYWEKKLKEAESTDDDSLRKVRADELRADKSLTNEERAMLLRMVTSGATNDGAVVYGENGKIIVDFTNDHRYKASFYTKRDSIADALFRDTTTTPEEKAKLFSLMADDPFDVDGAVVYTMSKNEKGEYERNKVAVDFTNIDRYRASTRLSEAQYQGFLNAVEQGVPEDIASTAFIQYTVQKKQESKGADDRFHEWLFKTVNDPHQRAVIDMHVIGNMDKVDGTIGYKDGKVYADYSSKELYDAYRNGKMAEKADIVNAQDVTPQQKAETFASMYEGYTAKDGIVYNDKGVVKADYTSDEAYEASQIDESHYVKFTTAVEQGMSKENALKAVKMHKEIMTDEDKDNSTQAAKWIFSEYDNANDRAIAGSMFTTKDVTIKDGRTYDENGYIYRDYTSVAWYKLSNRTLSKDGKNKRYEAAQKLTKQGYTAEKIVDTYVELDKLSKKSEWKDYLKKHGYTDAQIEVFLWSKGWAK